MRAHEGICGFDPNSMYYNYPKAGIECGCSDSVVEIIRGVATELVRRLVHAGWPVTKRLRRKKLMVRLIISVTRRSRYLGKGSSLGCAASQVF